MKKILYIGNSRSSQTSAHRAKALERLGHQVSIADPYQALSSQISNKYLAAVHFRTGYRLLQRSVCEWGSHLGKNIQKPDLIWVDHGELLGVKAVEELKKFGVPLVLYNCDDPTGKRDGRRFDSLKSALHLYDLCAVVREESATEFKELGAPKVVKVWRSYDEIAHAPFVDESNIPTHFLSEVAFIGTWMRHERREEFLLALMKGGINLSIWGPRWRKSDLWEEIKGAYRGESLSGRDYVAAIQGSKLSLGLLSKGNRDLHTQRSLEIPFSKGLFCAERTREHLELYNEGAEALFWESPEECVSVCRKALEEEDKRLEIVRCGHERVKGLKVGNEDTARFLLEQLG